MRRKAGHLVPLEIAICDAAARLRRRGVNEFRGYEIAKRIGEDADAELLTAYSTLDAELGRWRDFSYTRLRHFGYRFDTY